MAATTDFTVILKIFQYLNIPSVQHLLPHSVLKRSHDMKFLVPLLTSFLQSQNNLAMDKVLNKMGLTLGSVRRSLLQPPGWKSNCTPYRLRIERVSARTITSAPFGRAQQALRGYARVNVTLLGRVMRKLAVQMSQLHH